MSNRISNSQTSTNFTARKSVVTKDSTAGHTSENISLSIAAHNAKQKPILGNLKAEGLDTGQKGQAVSHLQQKLNAHNTSTLNPDIKDDGIFGEQTTKYLKTFQKSRGLEASGKLDKATLAALNETPISKSEVLSFQELLNDKMSSKSTKLNLDGVIGPKTFAAIQNFQKANGLKQSGHMDPETSLSLKRSFRSQQTEKILGKEGIIFGKDNTIKGVEKLSIASFAVATVVAKRNKESEFTFGVKKSSMKSSNVTAGYLTPKEISERATGLYEAMHAGVYGLGTDEASIQSLLEGVSPEDLSNIHKAYNDRYPGKDLIADFKEELSGAELAHVQALFSGDAMSSDIAAIVSAVEGFTDTIGAVGELGTNE